MNNKDFLYSRKWGVFIHYLEFNQNRDEEGNVISDWNTCTEALDVELLAYQLHKVNAGYLFFTMMQGFRYMAAPNDTFNKLTGFKPGEACCRRDVIEDLYCALKKYDIPLFLYFTGDGPNRDEEMIDLFGISRGYPNEHEERFFKMWASVFEEYCVRYGDKVKGWWMDGMNFWYGYEKDENLKLFVDAAKKGNPESLFAANYYSVIHDGFNEYFEGVGEVPMGEFYHNICPPTKFCDFTAGESNWFDMFTSKRFINGAQAHVLSFLGIPKHPMQVFGGWASRGSKYSPEYMRKYVECMNQYGGVVTIDVHMDRKGNIDPDQFKVLQEVGKIER